jgi:DNA-binding response OmpR family regulator
MAEPALESAPAPIRPRAHYARNPAGSTAGSVLVLDADDERRDLLADVVTRAGGEHSLAASGAEAIEQLRSSTAQAILVAGLPDGTRAAFVAWARPRYPHVAIAAVAEHVEHATELYNAGADVVMILPIDHDLLGAKLGAAIRGAQRPRLRLV